MYLRLTVKGMGTEAFEASTNGDTSINTNKLWYIPLPQLNALKWLTWIPGPTQFSKTIREKCWVMLKPKATRRLKFSLVWVCVCVCVWLHSFSCCDRSLLMVSCPQLESNALHTAAIHSWWLLLLSLFLLLLLFLLLAGSHFSFVMSAPFLMQRSPNA